jgi:hypothetical protein
MAKSKNSVITYGLSGKVGNLLVFKQVNGQTIVSKVPSPPKTSTEKQTAPRKRFKQAVPYAKTAINSPETKELYRQAATEKGKKSFNLAVADFFNAPDIDSIDISEYSGNPGDRIRIVATDDFAVKPVSVRIINVDGSLVEEGEAVQSAGSLWIYTAVQHSEHPDGGKIIITVSDLSEKKRSIGKTNRQTHSVPDGTVVFVIVPVFYQHSVPDGTRLLRLPSRQGRNIGRTEHCPPLSTVPSGTECKENVLFISVQCLPGNLTGEELQIES